MNSLPSKSLTLVLLIARLRRLGTRFRHGSRTPSLLRQEYSRKVPQKIVLVGGRTMADLMIEHNVGVVGKQHLSIKKIDSEYFETL